MPSENGHNVEFPPVIPVGMDAYRQWERWAQQRIGVRAYLRSTYDRTGHNNTADASHYLYQLAEDFNVALDVEGAGVLYFVRTNRWHGSPWHYEIDGVDYIVAESTTANPLDPSGDSVFLPEAPFPTLLTYTYATTHGADLNWVPMAFTQRLRLAYARTFYGTGYYIYQQFVPGARLSAALAAWNGTAPDRAVLELLSSSGSDVAADTPDAREDGGSVEIVAGRRTCVLELRDGPAMLRKLSFSAPAAHALEFGNTRLTITWDDRPMPSIDAPLDLFFGAGALRDSGAEWLVKALPMAIRFNAGRVALDCYFPMPFFRSARIDLTSPPGGDARYAVQWAVRCVRYDGPWNHVGYFHATYRDHGVPQLGHDLTFLDTQGVEGAEQWSGQFVGTSFIFTERDVLTTLEGDPRFFFDDSRTPQVQGTGTEEWGGGGDYWGGRTMTLPLAGHPVGVGIHSAYRYLLADLMPFGKRARICFEHGGENESVEHYRSVSYWYGLPSPSLVLTDRLEIGDPKSEASHAYQSPDASATYTVESRYEWGPDHLPLAHAAPLAAPRDYVDFEFDAPAGRYYVWVELKTSVNGFADAAVWVQFNDDIGTAVLRPAYMGSLGCLNGGRPADAYVFSTGARPTTPAVELRASGVQRLRVQTRFGRPRFERIVLGTDQVRRPAADVEPHAGLIVLGVGEIRRRSGAFDVVEDMAAAGGRAVALTSDPPTFEVFPAHTLTGRRTTGVSEFTLRIRADNHGVMLRRTLDYQYANQRACVFILDEGRWQPAGVWYLAGSNTVYHSFPIFEGELAPVRPTVITSNRRFRDDEFLLPVALTRGKSEIRIRLQFAPRNPPLLLGSAPTATAWTELVYVAYSYVMPRVELD